MIEIYDINNEFKFSNLKLSSPTSANGGNYFLKFSMNSNPLYIQSPKCITRGGFVKAGKKMQCELMFTNEDASFIHWMENLETHCYRSIYEKRKEWFTMEMEMNDIENYFVSPLKIYKSGKFYLLKVNVSSTLGKTSLKIYDENETPLEMESIQENTKVITILEIQSVKCSSRSFQIEIELKQMMVLNPNDIFEKCIIKSSNLPKLESLPIIDEPSANQSLNLNDKEPISEMTETDSSLETPILSALLPKENDLEMVEVDLTLEQIPETESFHIQKRDDVYYKMYLEAKQKAKLAKELALAAYLEMKRIQNTYLLKDEDEEDLDLSFSKE
jgi:hypothetical protein